MQFGRKPKISDNPANTISKHAKPASFLCNTSFYYLQNSNTLYLFMDKTNNAPTEKKGERSRKFKVLTVESLAESNEAWSRDLPCLLNIHLLSVITVMSHLNSLFLLYYSNATALLYNCDV